MKKIILTSCLLFGLALAFNTTSYAQESSDVKIGGGIAYGTEAEAIGVQIGAKYAFTPEISGAADFTYFFPDVIDWWEINANGHYHFYAEEGTRVYGLAGLNYATLSYDMGSLGSASDSEVGLNIGGGAEFAMDFADIYTELKYVLGSTDQLGISAGLRFGI
ncbi:hypothetical protein SAMN05443144_109102 [Fodinibius roseus]|uniref:Outer membrane protein beta-barrel domain-containing protein n=1 Tax=Fodinibius roseus TaxID=1194090 RepID=A0A1M5C584_9BACT|nr:hypothetical protein [Fodinibius roseus]SHF49871.1 hypothetical protein SAMN05443144_109102 [Fodinibius roseus]